MEYIEREALLELYADAPDMKFDMMSVPIPIIRQNILDMPAADVVKVVRCNVCSRRRDINECPMCGLIDGVAFDYTRDNGYCDRGERNG